MSFNDDRGVTRDGRKTTATRFAVTREERELLVNLVTRHKAVIENKGTDALAQRAKDSAWEKLTSEYNSQPGIRRVTVAQLRKLWDNEKSRWKKKQSGEKRNLHATGGGPSTCRPMSPSLALVGAAASHMGTRLQNSYDSDGVHLYQQVLSSSPSRVCSLVAKTTRKNCLVKDEWAKTVTCSNCRAAILHQLMHYKTCLYLYLQQHLTVMLTLLTRVTFPYLMQLYCVCADETIQPQLRSSEGAGSPGPQTTQPSTEGACASCPSHTLAVVAPGNEESRTAAAASEENGENLVGAEERQRPKSTRSRLAAIERGLVPEATARMEALKTDEQRKAQLHALELRLRKQQLLHQRKMHRMQVQREQELHKMQVQLLEQQLEQQKWRFNIERQKLLFELHEKQQQCIET
ncbi:uncharacterized protein LOC142787054 [Rhipicephalus microplus]|uniref:uncharacterized protein LOC142787054 n=1 Tax=Rhipicephalus microplus TaxID=6941 RepID=UPI003F6D3107